jgi:hypothetical protein
MDQSCDAAMVRQTCSWNLVQVLLPTTLGALKRFQVFFSGVVLTVTRSHEQPDRQNEECVQPHDILLYGKKTRELRTQCHSLHENTDTETVELGAVARITEVAIRRAAENGITAPRTAPQHSVLACSWSLRIGNVLLRIRPVPILTPLPDIPVHVVKTPGIGWKTAHRHGLFSIHAFIAIAIGEVAVVVGLVRGNRCAKVKR